MDMCCVFLEYMLGPLKGASPPPLQMQYFVRIEIINAYKHVFYHFRSQQLIQVLYSKWLVLTAIVTFSLDSVQRLFLKIFFVLTNIIPLICIYRANFYNVYINLVLLSHRYVYLIFFYLKPKLRVRSNSSRPQPRLNKH